jgi:hypothetical protein
LATEVRSVAYEEPARHADVIIALCLTLSLGSKLRESLCRWGHRNWGIGEFVRAKRQYLDNVGYRPSRSAEHGRDNEGQEESDEELHPGSCLECCCRVVDMVLVKL